MLFLRGAVSHAPVGEAVPAICEGEIPAIGEAVRAMVREDRVRPGRLPAKDVGACGAFAAKARIPVAPVRRIAQEDAESAALFDLELGGVEAQPLRRRPKAQWSAGQGCRIPRAGVPALRGTGCAITRCSGVSEGGRSCAASPSD